MSSNSEFRDKLDRVEAFLDREGLQGVLLSTQRNFAWLTCGGSNHVGLATTDGVASLLVLRQSRRFVISSNNESARIGEEETLALGFEPIEIPWHELRSDPHRVRRAVAEITNPDNIGSDAIASFSNIEGRFAANRYRLHDDEIKRYRAHAAETGRAIEETARTLDSGWSERDVEALLTFNLMKRGARPTVLLVAGDDRFRKYRHPIPTEQRISRFVALSTCARRWGLTAAVTRLVHFGSIPPNLTKTYQALRTVEQRLLESTIPGVTAGAIFERLQAAYQSVGFAEAWREHHQGGATGYLEREWVAIPGGAQTVESAQAFAWNPTITGTKIEDTVLVTPAGAEVLTDTGEWPSSEFRVGERAVSRPDILCR